MTKKIKLTALLIVIYTFTYGQDKFVYDQRGLNPKYVVVEMDGLKQDELFKKTINWIKETYKNPDEVIKTTIDNKKVRFEGFKDNIICIKSLGMVYCYDGLYTIEIEFKDNKYKFTPMSIEYRVPASQYSVGGMRPISLSDGSAYYKKGKLRKMYNTIPLSVEMLLNGLNLSLSKYLSTEQEEGNDDW